MRRIILDTDVAMSAPGSDIDDGFALALAVADPDLEVELVTTVNGNTDVETVTQLTLELLSRLGRPDVRVVKGAARPLRRAPYETAARRLAQSALTGIPTRAPAKGYAASAIVDLVMGEPVGRYTLVCIGPLTNAALALAMEPALAGQLEEIVIMGGAFQGHTNQAGMPGEFNMWVDPDAAAIVLSSGASLRLVGLDVTLQVRLTIADAEYLAQSGHPFGEFAGRASLAWIEHLALTGRGLGYEAGSCAMHDPLAVAVVAHPDLVTWRAASVAVETVGDVARGVTIADFLEVDLMNGAPQPIQNCVVAAAVRADEFTTYFLKTIGTL